MISVNCNLCGQDDWVIRYPATAAHNKRISVDVFRCTSPDYGSHAQIVQCNHCGLVYSNPRWSDAELKKAYADVEDDTYVEEREGREITFEKHLRQLERFTGPGNGRSLLDVGAYIGVFVEIAQKSGWNAYGVEPSNWAVSLARRSGLQIIEGTQESQLLKGLKFDVVTLWDVIEHVTDPASELKRSFELLKPGGWLAVHTMDIDSYMSHLLKHRWPWLMDMHLYYFSRNTLAALLYKCGFRVVWSGSQGRYLRLGYLSSRLKGFYHPIGKAASTLFNTFNVNKVAIPVNFGDLFTIYAQRPLEKY